MQALNELLNSKSVVLPPYKRVEFWIVGVGGTGSLLVRLIARIANSLIRDQKEVRVCLVDPDYVEGKNVDRQDFCQAEVGQFKARTLAARYGFAWEWLPIEAFCQPFTPGLLDLPEDNELILLLGCVDGPEGRRQIAKALDWWRYRHTNLWWIDAGNDEQSGQVLVGNSTSLKFAEYDSPMGWLRLPSPGLVAPDLLLDRPEDTELPRLSCAEQAIANAQSLTVNAMSATVAANLVNKLLMGKLNRYAVYFDQTHDVMSPKWATPDAVRSILDRHQISTPSQSTEL